MVIFSMWPQSQTEFRNYTSHGILSFKLIYINMYANQNLQMHYS